MVSVPPLAAMAEVSFTQAEAEVALVEHEGVHDSSQAYSSVLQAELEQKRMFPKFEASYEEYVDGFQVIFSWNGFGVADVWLLVIVIGT